MHKSTHKLNGLHLEDSADTPHVFSAPSEIAIPKWRDNRSICLPTNNQGSTSECVAYAFAGYIEVLRLVRDGTAEQINPAPIYTRAKYLSPRSQKKTKGTTITLAFMACMSLGLLPDNAKIRLITNSIELRSAMFRQQFPGVAIAAYHITDGWYNADTDGWIGNQNKFVGDHCVLACQYNERGVGNQNSWNDTHGAH